MIKNGTEHRRSLQDGREVYIEGARVHDVTTDRSFARSVASICGLYCFFSVVAMVGVMVYRRNEYV